MQITLLSTSRVLPASELVSITYRTDLIPVPVSAEFSVQSTKDNDKEFVEGAEIIVGDSVPLTIIKATPVKTQTIKDGRRIGGIACLAIPSGCQKLIEPTAKAIILNSTSFNSVLRACGLKARLGSDIPLPEYVCLKGTIPTYRLALYLQQEACVIAARDGRIGAFKIDGLLKGEVKEVIDPSAVVWVNSQAVQNIQKNSYVSVNSDDSSVMGGDTTKGQAVIQRARLDERQLKNLEKVLICRGTVVRAYNNKLTAGDVVEIDGRRYVILTCAHRFDSGNLGGASVTTTKLWVASL